MPQIREQIAMVHLPPSKTLKYLFHVRKTKKHRNLDTRFRCFLLYAIITSGGIDVCMLV